MRLICPFTALHDATTDALDATGHPWEAWQLSEDDDYWCLLGDLWADGGGFIICEHDVLPRADSIGELELCDCDWGGFTTPYVQGENFGMSLVKFSERLVRSFPNAIEQIGRYQDATHPPKHWCRLDLWLQRAVLWPAGLQPHVHGAVGHLNREPRHGCHRLAADTFHRG